MRAERQVQSELWNLKAVVWMSMREPGGIRLFKKEQHGGLQTGVEHRRCLERSCGLGGSAPVIYREGAAETGQSVVGVR